MLVKPAEPIEIRQELFLPANFDDLTQRFLDESGESEMTPDLIRKQINGMIGGQFWTIRVDGLMTGYFYAEIMPTEYGNLVGLVHELFIEKNLTRPGIIQKVDETLDEWAKRNGASELAFFTRREPRAFMRLLKNKWRLDSWVLKRACV